uniref:Uncharacterized protein n=1 Tax=Pelagomonas calceolata TaxID=35677 RepID=A0A7S4E3G0_9STRA
MRPRAHPYDTQVCARMYRLVALASVAGALVAPPAARPTTRLSATEGASAPLGFWDPAGLSELGSDRTQAWFKAAETKHGRVAMAACTGWIVTEMGFRWPGAYDMAGHKFSDVPGGLAAEAVFRDNGGMVQILFSAGLVEFWSELQKPHYMSGGGSQKLPIWDPVGFTAGLSADELKTKRQAETNNGRLAMIGAAGFWSATYLDGSVPALTGTAFFQS